MLVIDSKVESFSQAYSEFYPIIYGTVFSKIRDVDRAEDICQEIFTRFFTKFEEVESHRKWLFGTMRFVLMEHFREKNYKDLDIDGVFDDVNLTYINSFKDTRLILEEALDEMDNFGDEKNRIVFELVTIQNFTYKETAKQMGITINQVRYILKNITNRFYDYFRKKGISSLEDLL